VRHGGGAAAVRAEFVSAAGERATLAVGIGPEGARRTRNDKPSSLAEHLAVQPVLAWTSAERELLTGAPAARRRFLDRGLVAERPAALADLAAYRRALDQKRALLARRAGRAEIGPWNELLAASAARLAQARGEYVARLGDELQRVLGAGDLEIPAVTLAYAPSPAVARDGRDAILAALVASGAEEGRRRQPLLGPHRDDLVISWGASRLRDTASAGERKALGLVLLLAQARLLERVREPPLLLLDDADTELDEAALARLWRLLGGRQILASSNRPGAWAGLPIEARWGLSQGNTKSL
jgi:DNA replication and repair protein RecF